MRRMNWVSINYQKIPPTKKTKMKTYSQNPWVAQDIADFNFLCCPECTYKSKVEEVFIEHAVEIHPKSKFSKIFNLRTGTLLSNQNIENEDRIIHCPTDTISIDMVEENVKGKYQLAMSEDRDDLLKENFDEDYYEKGKSIQLKDYLNFLNSS
jgi:hypothetical protein